MKFQRTDGIHSLTGKLTLLQVVFIRAEYDSGKRGRVNAWRHGIGEVQYNKIGRRQAWKSLTTNASK